MAETRALIGGVAAMTVVVVSSNVLVQYPVEGTVGGLDLAAILTWGAFTYPAAFLVTEVCNRNFGPALARKVALAGFAVAVLMSAALASPRIALASGAAFLCAQMFDVALFDRLRNGVWWRAPLAASYASSALDTALFFSIAFSAAIAWGGDPFALATQPLFGLSGAPQAPRWISWALADFCVKIIISTFALGPYRAMTARRTVAGA